MGFWANGTPGNCSTSPARPVIVAAGAVIVTTGVVDRGSIGLANVNEMKMKAKRSEFMLVT